MLVFVAHSGKTLELQAQPATRFASLTSILTSASAAKLFAVAPATAALLDFLHLPASPLTRNCAALPRNACSSNANVIRSTYERCISSLVPGMLFGSTRNLRA